MKDKIAGRRGKDFFIFGRAAGRRGANTSFKVLKDN